MTETDAQAGFYPTAAPKAPAEPGRPVNPPSPPSPKRPRPTPTRGDYRRCYSGITREGDFVALPRRMCRRLGLRASAVLMNSLSRLQCSADDEGFALLTSSYNGTALALDDPEEIEAVTRLQALGVVHVEYRGTRRYLSIDLHRLEEIMADAR
jgi:hypothetical protein